MRNMPTIEKTATGSLARLFTFAICLLCITASASANPDLIAYYNFEGAATSPFPVNGTSHAPAFFDGSDPQRTSTLVPTNLSAADMTPGSGLPFNQVNQVGSNDAGLGFLRTGLHSPADLDMPLSSSQGFQNMTVTFAVSNTGLGYEFYQGFYSTDGGGTFTAIGVPELISASSGLILSFTVPDAANNAPNLVLRLELSSGQSNGGILQNVIDNIQVNGTIDPDTDGDGVRNSRDNCVSTPNPEKVAFTSFRNGNGEIYVMNADGTNQTRLTNNPPADEIPPKADELPAFSPDGSKIAFRSNRDGNREIYLMNADGTNQTRLTNNPAVDDSPSFSPDGSKIAFTSNRDGNPNWQIYVMNADGTGQTNLSNNAAGDVDPSFSRDGSKIVFTSVRDGNPEIYVMNADGSGQTRLTNDAETDAEPSLSPDGSTIAFRSNRNGNSEIYVMNADGTGQTNLTNHAGIHGRPSFSPDGSKIVFWAARDSNNYEIYVMNADGSGLTNLTNNRLADVEPSWGPQADSDGDGVGDACEVQPTTTTIDTPAATQYSDVVTLSSTTTANGSPVTTGTVEFFVNGVSVGTDTVDANGVATLNKQILLAAGSYTVEAQYAANGDLLASSDTDSLTVTKEDATVTASAINAVSVKVNSPGGTAGPISLCANITDAADGSLGNIALAVPVTFTLAAVAPGTQVPLPQQDAALTAGTACVTFNNVSVNVYDVTITVGGNYYTGTGSTVLAVFDPSLGFTTGGGRVINQAGNTLHFGFSFKYDKKGFKGQMLVMEHLPNGSVVKLKSNSLSSLSIVGSQAIVLGKASISNGSGNLNFRLDVKDNGEPGSSDKFGLKVTTSGGSAIPAFTIDPPQTILGGNIQVPQGSRR